MKKIINHLASDWYKYLLELIVITAGVLGAFALNSWNEANENEVKRKHIYQQILGEIKQDARGLRMSLESHDYSIQYLRRIKTDSARGLDSLNRHLNSYYFFNPSMAAYETLKQTGDLKLIQGELLEKIVFNYERRYQLLLGWSEYHEDLIIRNVEPYILTSIPVNENMMTDSVVVMKERDNFLLTNLINSQISTLTQINRRLESAKTDLDSLINDLESELGIKNNLAN